MAIVWKSAGKCLHCAWGSDVEAKMRNRLACLFVAAAAIAAVVSQRALDAQDGEGKAPAATPSYADDVRPLFQAKCARCHGTKTHRADLDLTTPAGIRKGGESGAVIVPGKPKESLLFEKVHSGAMPPKKEDRLSAAEVERIRAWIAAGAKLDTENTAADVNQHDVIPVLLRHCTVCHGRHRKEAGLDLRTKATMLKGGKSGPAIVLGKPGESLLIRKLRAGQMPPPDRLVEVSIKPIESAEVDTLAHWIAAGAPEVAIEPDVATTTPDPLVTDKDRDFWAFRAPRPVNVPAVRHTAHVRNPIDAFILARLEPKGLTFAPEADAATLVRRAFIDLTGLPPEPAELQAFLGDTRSDAYERLIDRLLASPRYGERWGRYWLDLAGYADSEGKREQDLPRPHAWRYRDYVIRSLNADKPYDRFLREQLAGDELADYASAPEVTQELYDNLVATGFLRMAPDATWANITGFIPDRLEVIADEIDVLGSAVMGLSLKCARCHSHKFDPIPHRDYYRLVAVFRGAFDEYDWLKPDVRPGLGPVSQDPLGGRNLPQVMTAERKAWQAQPKPGPEPRIHALWDRGEPSPTYIYRRGDYLNPGRLVGPGVPSVLTDGKTPFDVQPPWPGAKSTGRRLAFARWLTQPNHPLTSRVAVNRVWKHHFGTGIVKTLGNFGKAGTPPTHPEFLDWLAQEFVRQGWSLKALHRLMMTSTTYRQSSRVSADREKRDPENVLLSRMPLARLDAESLYDSLLAIAGRLDTTPFGPPDAVAVRPDGLITPTESPHGWRRMIYVRQARKQIPTHLENFDYPQMNPNCIERRDSTVAPQALHLLNNAMVHRLAESFAARVRREAGPDIGRQVESVYLIALSRMPSAAEARLGRESVGKLTEQWLVSGQPRPVAEQKALASYCHAIVNSAGFLYVD
jgi:mono/diheme cytochrome c family protein